MGNCQSKAVINNNSNIFEIGDNNHIICPNKSSIVDTIIINFALQDNTYIITLPTISAVNQLYDKYCNNNIDICTEYKSTFDINTKILIMTYKHLLFCILQSKYKKNNHPLYSYIKTIKTIVFADCTEMCCTNKDNDWELIIMLCGNNAIQFIFLEFYAETLLFTKWVKTFQNREFSIKSANHAQQYNNNMVYISTNCTEYKVRNNTMNYNLYHLLLNGGSKIEHKNSYNTKKNIIDHIVLNVSSSNKLPALFVNYSISCNELMAINTSKIYSFINNTNASRCLNNILVNTKYDFIRDLSEFISLVRLLKKGIAFYHSSMLQILRNLVEELLFKNVIKVLFATDVLPNNNYKFKSIVFTSLQKFDGVKYSCISNELYRKTCNLSNNKNKIIVHCLDLFHTSLDYKSYSNIVNKSSISYSFHNDYALKHILHLSIFMKKPDLLSLLSKGYYYNANLIKNCDEMYHLTESNLLLAMNVSKYNYFVDPVELYKSSKVIPNKRYEYVDYLFRLIHPDSVGYVKTLEIILLLLSYEHSYSIIELQCLCSINEIRLCQLLNYIERIYTINNQLSEDILKDVIELNSTVFNKLSYYVYNYTMMS